MPVLPSYRNQSIDLQATLAFNGLNEFVKKGKRNHSRCLTGSQIHLWWVHFTNITFWPLVLFEIFFLYFIYLKQNLILSYSGKPSINHRYSLFFQVKKESAESEPAWQNAGTSVGVQIWRINKFKVICLEITVYAASSCQFKVKNRNTRKRCEIC